MPARPDSLLPQPRRRAPHVIETLEWSCRFADARSAARHQQRLSRFLQEQGARVMQALFEQLSPPGEIWHIDRIEVDLGQLRPDASTDQWAHQLHQRLYDELLRLRADHAAIQVSPDLVAAVWSDTAESPVPASDTPRPASEHSLDHFLYYVEFGHLPWSAGALAGRDLAGWLERLASRDGSRLWAQLQQLPLAEQTLQRLSHISPHHGLQALLAARHTGLSAGLTQLDEQVLLPLQARGRLSAYQLQQLQQAWRVAGLRALWGNSSSVLSADRLRQLVLTLTQSLNRMLGPGWRTLLKPATQAGNPRAPSDVAQLLLQGVLDIHTEESSRPRHRADRRPQAPATQDLREEPSSATRAPAAPALERTTRAALARLLALLERPSDAENSGRARELLHTLAQHSPDELRAQLQLWTRQRARRLRWARRIPPGLLWPLLQGLAQQSTSATPTSPESTRSIDPAAAPWAESLRQFVLNRLSARGAPGGSLSQWQSQLIDFTLRHLALGGSLPRDHQGWQRLWQAAWEELAGDESAIHSAPESAESSPQGFETLHSYDADGGARPGDLATQVQRWLLGPAGSSTTPWWVAAPVASSPLLRIELMAGLRARSVRTRIASHWPEPRRLQLIHLLLWPTSPAWQQGAPSGGSPGTERPWERWLWVAEQVRRRTENPGAALTALLPIRSPLLATPSGSGASSDTTDLESWLWLSTIEWAMQTHTARPDAASLARHWQQQLLALTSPARRPLLLPEQNELAPLTATGTAVVPANRPESHAAPACTAPTADPCNKPAPALPITVLDTRTPDPTSGQRLPDASATDCLASFADASLANEPGSALENGHAFGLQDLEAWIAAPLGQWTARMRLRVASLLENDSTRSRWSRMQSSARQRQLLRHQYPAAFPMLDDCVDLLLLASRQLAPGQPPEGIERRVLEFVTDHLFGDGGHPEAGELARRYALDSCLDRNDRDPGTRTRALAHRLTRLDAALSALAATAETAHPERSALVQSMRQALQPPLTPFETHSPQGSEPYAADDDHMLEPSSSPIDGNDLRGQLDALLGRPAMNWRSEERLRLAALLDREEACSIWLEHHDEAQRWALLDRHLTVGTVRLRASMERLIVAALTLQAADTIEQASLDCWTFLAQHLFVDGLATEPGLLARRYAMHLRHLDLDAGAGQSVSFQRWTHRLAEALQRSAGATLDPPTAMSSDTIASIEQPADTHAHARPTTTLVESMLKALQEPPARSEQWEAALTIERRQQLRYERPTAASDRTRDALAPAVATSSPDTGAGPIAANPLSAIPATRQRELARTHRRVLPGDERNPIYVSNAGLVLLANYSQRLFGLLELLDGAGFVDEAAQWRAVHALEYLVHGHSDSTEPEWVLTKLLCGLPLQHSVPPCQGLDEACRSALDGLLRAVITHWKAIGNTSVAGLRESFLQRRGRLVRRIGQDSDLWQLKVEQRPFDLLIDRLPWGFSTIKLPWMPGALHVDWR